MNVFKFIMLGVSVALFFLLTGCQGNNGDALNSSTINPIIPSTTVENTSPTSIPKTTVILPVSSTVLSTNSQVVNIDVRVFDSANNPYSSGKVVKINPSDVLSGRDIGTFDKQSSDLVNGVASFVYTAPVNLELDTSNLSFGFYHDSNSSDIKVYTISIVPKANQTVVTNYVLKSSSAPGVTMNLDSSEIISYTVYDTSGKQLLDSSMQSVTITSLNPSLAFLSDNFGNKGSVLTIKDKNSITINVNSNTKSGLVPVKVEAKFRDVNGVDRTLTEIFGVLVLSGPPSAISLSYASTEQVKERAKFIERWVVTVTDKYSNLVNSNPSVAMGMIAGYTQSSAATSNAGNYLHFIPSSSAGSISALNNTFTAQTDVFSNVDFQNDVLVVYGTGYKYDASGKWDITQNSSRVLNLVDDYNSTDRTKMGFAVGNNQREDTCDIGAKWVANVYSDSNTSIIGNDGTMVIDVEYDYYLTGKSTMLWINLVGMQNSTGKQIRIGEARKINLRGQGLDGEKYAYAQGFQGLVRLNVSVKNTVEWYYNANFAYQVVVTGNGTAWSIIGTSMDNGITSCINSGVGYVDVFISSPAPNPGTVELKKLLTKAEF